MPTLITRYNWGSALANDNPELTRQLNEVYTSIATVVNTKSSVNVQLVDPPNNVTDADINKNYTIGDLWVNSSTDKAWIMTSRTSLTMVNWQIIT